MRQGMIFTLSIIICVSVAFAEDGLITKRSAYSVAETLNRLERVLREKGVVVFARIDHAAGAESIGRELRATEVLIFGNPRLGTPLLQSNQTVGIDLPLKALAWEDETGQVWLTYNAPAFLASRRGIIDRGKVVEKMTTALDNCTNQATRR
ncbi:MAG: DUF302 domain-containing protein [Candidatus Methylomirabilales bacterium]